MEYFLAFYIAAIIFCMARLYFPAYRFMAKVFPESMLIKYKVLGFVITLVLFTLAAPILLVIAFSDKYTENFIVTYIDEILQHEQRKQKETPKSLRGKDEGELE